MNKKVLVLVLGLLLLASPVFAAFVNDDESIKFNMAQLRYRFQYFIESDYGTEDSKEYLDDDFDTKWVFSKGELELYFEIEIADSNMGDDKAPNTDWDSVLGAYGGKWRPESLADSSFMLQVGDFGTGFGKAINNDDSPRGSIEASWKMGDVSAVLGYGRRYEGATNDDVEGDEHLIRGQVHMPLGDSGFNLGAYAALYTGSDLIFKKATDTSAAITGDRNVFLGAFEFSGKVSNLDLYSEAGFATGKSDETGKEVDLSGFYIMGGTSVGVGQVTLGIEGGFATGDEDGWEDGKDKGFTAVNSDFWLGQVLHDEGLILRSNGKDGGLSNIIYGQVTAAIKPTDKLSLDAGLLYMKPVEKVNGAESYGTEVFGTIAYKLADSLAYKLYWGYAIPDDDFIKDNQYQLHNRLEFNF